MDGFHTRPPDGTGLYAPAFEHDGCGFGLLAQMDGRASHALVRRAIAALDRLTHRGAVAADGKSGDGCGVLLGLPVVFLRGVAQGQGIRLPARFAVGMVYLARAPGPAGRARRALERELTAQGLAIAGWRAVPLDPAACGPRALETLPEVAQVYAGIPDQMDGAEVERRLYVARQRAGRALHGEDSVFHVATLSARRIAYKGLVLPGNLTRLYPDLADPRMASAICVFHQRFSTNTWPQWRLAQPFRLLAHNGELNSLSGNRNWAEARRGLWRSALLPDLAAIYPWLSHSGSDSYTLDNMLELLLAGGMGLFRALRLLIPPAWQNDTGMDPDLRAFHAYHAMHTEPWDGPAGIVLSDGRYAACLMDRNGLRPARYSIDRGRCILLASEAGVEDRDPAEIVEKGRLGPGDLLAVDTRGGRLLRRAAIDRVLARRRPYRAWLRRHARRLEAGDEAPPGPSGERLAAYEKLFGVSREEREQVLAVLAEAGAEALGSMGDDTPLPPLSRHPRSLFDAFRQQFAQVTNPPIDPLRERLVMSLETYLGRERNLFEETPEHARRLVLDSPVLATAQARQLLAMRYPDLPAVCIVLCQTSGEELRAALERLIREALAAVRAGSSLLWLSDAGLERGQVPVHPLLAVGAVHHGLIRAGRRCDANLVVETGAARDPHQVAALLGYGASAVHPYLAYAVLWRMAEAGELGEALPARALAAYRRGIDKGLLKILSKMGISSVASYRGAQLFEAVGLAPEVVSLCFEGTVSRIGGAGFPDLERDQRQLHDLAWDPLRPAHPGGLLKYVHGGEYHAFNPDVVQALHAALRSGDAADYRRYAEAVHARPPAVLRDLLALPPGSEPVDLSEVEPVAAILPRFETGAMSLGALSPEAHETLAAAMHRLGGRSNSGEGGEDPRRDGSARASKIRQVASGRFGVTPRYLVHAEVLQIKIAQGAKPGEGGQLVGTKVDALIARLRHTLPGTTLISPPPHHDIYSIEDLAELIHDLREVHPRALISVKLVAEPGVGTVAAGVAKAHADLITVSGYDGGTGASPLSSVKYAGGPWELGLAETQQVLRANGLRGRVRLQVDGGLKTGLDVVKAALLGAESFGFGTAALVAMGCKYLRICHLNNCATGVATQDPRLRRAHFRGEVEKVVWWFRCVAEEVRGILATLGARSLDEVIGHPEHLRVRPGETERQAALDLSPLLSEAGVAAEAPRRATGPPTPPRPSALAERLTREGLARLESGLGGRLSYAIDNRERALGARLSGEIARRYGDQGYPGPPLVLRLRGSAGQSLGAWNTGGLWIELEGEANDYVGKGMAGGRIVLRPPERAGYAGQASPILGNTCLYGATGGELYAAGRAGERFAVRNSGVRAVVEGVGDHGCEYMTGGMVVVLGPLGVNFGAGMTGGLAVILDRQGDLARRINPELVELEPLPESPRREALLGRLETLLRAHSEATGSRAAGELLGDLAAAGERLWLVRPRSVEIDTLLQPPPARAMDRRAAGGGGGLPSPDRARTPRTEAGSP